MTDLQYDGTYEGWLTAVFEGYNLRLTDVTFSSPEAAAPALLGTAHPVLTDEVKAERVLAGLRKRLSDEGLTRLYKTFLSEIDQREAVMWQFVRHVFDSPQNVEEDYGHPAVWTVRRAAKRVRREAHRMEAFVRFQLTKDNLYYAIIEPECDVLPLIAGHFEGRYADQRWLIYDARRRYGVYYDLERTDTVTIDFRSSPASASFIEEIGDEREAFYQELWRRYFKSVTIDARRNMKLHLQHMPKRYWKHLTEKKPGG